MPLSQSMLDNAGAAMIAAMLPKAPMETIMAQSIGIQAKAAGISVSGERGVDLVHAAAEARAASQHWALDDPLKLAMDAMLVTLMSATGAVGKQASDMKLPR